MHDIDAETYTEEEKKEEECIMGNTEIMRKSLEELHQMLNKAEEYVDKVLVY